MQKAGEQAKAVLDKQILEGRSRLSIQLEHVIRGYVERMDDTLLRYKFSEDYNDAENDDDGSLRRK